MDGVCTTVRTAKMYQLPALEAAALSLLTQIIAAAGRENSYGSPTLTSPMYQLSSNLYTK